MFNRTNSLLLSIYSFLCRRREEKTHSPAMGQQDQDVVGYYNYLFMATVLLLPLLLISMFKPSEHPQWHRGGRGDGGRRRCWWWVWSMISCVGDGGPLRPSHPLSLSAPPLHLLPWLLLQITFSLYCMIGVTTGGQLEHIATM